MNKCLVDCLRRAGKRGVSVFVESTDKPRLIFVRDGHRVVVSCEHVTLPWLNATFPIRPTMSRYEQRALFLELVAWDHSFVYRTGDMKYDPSCARSGLLREFYWASANPDMFE